LKLKTHQLILDNVWHGTRFDKTLNLGHYSSSTQKESILKKGLTVAMTKTQASTWISSAGKKNSQDYGNPD
jgi:hypothetical protein